MTGAVACRACWSLVRLLSVTELIPASGIRYGSFITARKSGARTQTAFLANGASAPLRFTSSSPHALRRRCTAKVHPWKVNRNNYVRRTQHDPGTLTPFGRPEYERRYHRIVLLGENDHNSARCGIRSMAWIPYGGNRRFTLSGRRQPFDPREAAPGRLRRRPKQPWVKSFD